MSAACSGCLQKQQGRVRATGPAPMMRAGTVAVALSLAMGSAVWAGETKGQGSTQVAAADATADTLPYRLGMPLPRIDLDVDLKVLLAQHRPPATQNDATASEDTILVAIVLAVPQSVDEDIAKQHGLELLERTELPDLNLRIVQFRVLGDRSTERVLADLRNDQRIRRAQQNAQYSVPSQGKGGVGVSRLNGPPAEALPPRSDRKGSVVAKVVLKPGDPAEPVSVTRRAGSLKGEAVSANALQSLRADKVGDVLSGGL